MQIEWENVAVYQPAYFML